MKNIRTEITIKTSIERAWQVLTVFDAYEDWNPFVHIKGKPGLGEKIENTMFMDEQGKPQVFRPTITRWEINKGFTWLGHLFIPGIFDGEHFFELEQIEGQHIKLIHGENFSGLLSGILMRLIGTKTKLGFERMNSALKNRLEEELI